jgi:hypothetical protein
MAMLAPVSAALDSGITVSFHDASFGHPTGVDLAIDADCGHPETAS